MLRAYLKFTIDLKITNIYCETFKKFLYLKLLCFYQHKKFLTYHRYDLRSYQSNYRHENFPQFIRKYEKVSLPFMTQSSTKENYQSD